MYVSINQAWRPAPDQSNYPLVEVILGPNFVRTDPRLWGMVEIADRPDVVTIDVLRIWGAPEWDPRFDVMATEEYGSWRTRLGGNGNYTSLSGVHAFDAGFHIKRLEVYGVPGAGLIFHNCKTAQIDSALFFRVGWPVVQEWQAKGGAKLRGITSTDHWARKNWPPDDARDSVSLRRFDSKGLATRGETVTSGSNYVVEDMVHRGDGISLKSCGNRYVVRRCHLGRAYISGTPPSNLTNPIFQGYQNVLHAYGVLYDDVVFTGTPFKPGGYQAIVYISHPFEDVPVLRNCTFIRGAEPAAVQQNYNRIRYEGCHFVGWGTDWKAAFQLSPPWQGMPAATIEDGGGNVGWDS